MKEFKGSQRAILELISSENCNNELEGIIQLSNFKFSNDDLFMPKSKENFKEAELKDFLKDTDWPELANQIKDWWLEVVKPNTRSPNWDFVSTCSINGKKGLLLVEAKAHWNEVKENDKCGSTNGENRNKIQNAINNAKKDINEKISPRNIAISRDKCYQISNRIAHAWWLANQGVPVILLYLGFLNCQEMSDSGKVFENDSDWQKCFKDYAAKVGVDFLIDKEINCGKSQFKLICRSYPTVKD